MAARRARARLDGLCWEDPQVFKLALVQMRVGADKAENLRHARELIQQAAANKADIVALPECFNSPYGTKFFPEYAEPIPGPSTVALGEAARAAGVYLIGGSHPESDGGKLYNTSTVYNRQGELIAKHRKVHLFDIDVPGKIRFQESEVLTAGNRATMFDTEFGPIGLAICYDIRFPELAMLAARAGAKVMIYPGAFNLVTGNLHWELLQRSRALDNQIFVATVSPSRIEGSGYVAWGHSTVVDPWGQVQATTGHDEDIVYSDIDLAKVDEVRAAIPVTTQRRTDLYTTQWIGPQ